MKKMIAFVLFTLALLLCLLPAFSMADGDRYLEINEASFPDAIFRQYVIDKLAGGKEYMTQTEVESVTWIDVDNKGVASLKGIEHFPALEGLHCSLNQLTALDVSKNTALEKLWCYKNQLTVLDVNHNTLLKELHCSWNQLTVLNVSRNTALEKLDCSWNQLTTLDVSKNMSLKTLMCYFNDLTELDVSRNTALEDLDCSGNYLTALDVSHNTSLIVLISGTHSHFNSSGSFLWNPIGALDVSHNMALKELYCCENDLTVLDLSRNTALEKLDCSWNHQLTMLDVSHNTKLISLDCSRCTLTMLDVSHNPKLKSLDCSSDKLTMLDVSRNAALETLDCRWNQLTTLDMSHNTALEDLDCGVNRLTTLDVRHNRALKKLDCVTNALTVLDVSRNTALETLNCSNNHLPTLDLSANVKLTNISMDQKIPDQTLTSANGAYQHDLSQLVPLANMTKVTVSGDCQLDIATGKVTFAKKVNSFTYQYATGHGAMDVTVSFQEGSDPSAPPTIAQQPKDVKAKSGAKAKFTVKTKEKDVSFQWFVKAPGANEWEALKGGAKNTLTVTASGTNNGAQYRCLVKNKEGGWIYTSAAKLTVTLQPPVIKTQPKNQNVKSGAKAKFSVKASGKNISYQWYERSDAKSEWKLMKGETKNTLQVVASKATDGHQYYCHLKNTDGEADSKTAKLMVKTEAPTIKTQPKSVTVKSGKKAKFSVKASGKNLKYQWYERANADAEWTAVNGGTKNSLSVETSKAKNGCQYYCKVTNPDGTVNSAVATLTVTPEAPVIKTQPKDVKVKAGAKAKFKVKASPKNVTYQWYYRTSADGEWIKLDGATKAEYSFVASAEMFGWQFRCLAKNADGEAWSKAATLLQK